MRLSRNIPQELSKAHSSSINKDLWIESLTQEIKAKDEEIGEFKKEIDRLKKKCGEHLHVSEEKENTKPDDPKPTEKRKTVKDIDLKA